MPPIRKQSCTRESLWSLHLHRVGEYFQFGSVFIKKNNQTEILFFEKKTETEPKPSQTDRFRFGLGFIGKKPVQTGLARFFSVSVRFGFFSFLLMKPKPNRTGLFFQNFNRFNQFFFFIFFLFNRIFSFFAHPQHRVK